MGSQGAPLGQHEICRNFSELIQRPQKVSAKTTCSVARVPRNLPLSAGASGPLSVSEHQPQMLLSCYVSEMGRARGVHLTQGIKRDPNCKSCQSLRLKEDKPCIQPRALHRCSYNSPLPPNPISWSPSQTLATHQLSPLGLDAVWTGSCAAGFMEQDAAAVLNRTLGSEAAWQH